MKEEAAVGNDLLTNLTKHTICNSKSETVQTNSSPSSATHAGLDTPRKSDRSASTRSSRAAKRLAAPALVTTSRRAAKPARPWQEAAKNHTLEPTLDLPELLPTIHKESVMGLDAQGICTNKDDITNSAEISSSRDRMADSAEISGKNDHMTISHARRTKLCRDGDRAQKHAAGYPPGGQYKSQENSRRLKGRRAVSDTGEQDNRRKSCVEEVDTQLEEVRSSATGTPV
ncbi:uncharacterized protein UHOD_12346 [Ustilago sp. UG-2017b]|nr:uncharacterized protein UHOD_12346 [Ustilago sp. UG-2017b]